MSILNKFIRKRIIIGIHGLSNKPPKRILDKWWQMSIREGLAYIGRPETSFKFRSVYWADLLYEKPENPRIKDKKNPLYMDEPYVAGDPEEYKDFTPSRIKKILLDTVDRGIDKLFFRKEGVVNFDKYADHFIENTYKDLDFYYNHECSVENYKGQPFKHVIRMRLAGLLKKYKNREIFLIAHSMGSIISYDVLTVTSPEIKIHTLATIGSPLGLSVIIKKIYSEQGMNFEKEKRVASPENITDKWLNFSDLDDPVALVYSLAGDYKKNSSGIGPDDVIVHNNYKYYGKRNAHKLYGYLRTPEMAKAIYEFCEKNQPVILRFAKKIKSYLLKKS